MAKLIKGINDLKTKYTNLAAQWHPTRNEDPMPSDVSAGSGKRVWWLGSCGHEWEAIIHNHIARNAGCPYCANHAVLTGFNDLATKYPELASEP